MRRAVAATLVISAVLAGPWIAPSLAADPAEVEELIRQGVELRRLGRDPAAIPLFQRAYDLDRSPRTAAQLGLVEAAVGYWIAAEKHLAEALASPRHPWLVQHLGEIKETLEQVRANICELDVVGSPPGAEVIVNGKTVGRLPLAQPVRVAEGPVQVTLRAEGFAEGSSTTTVKGGGTERISVNLVAAPGYAAGPETARPPAGSAYPAPGTAPPYYPAGSDVGLGMSSRPAPGWVRPTAWVASAVAVAAAGLGTHQVLQQHKHQKAFNDYMRMGTTDRPCAILAIRRGGPPCDAIYENAQAASRLAVVGFASAGVLAAGAIVAFIASSSREGSRAAATGTPLVLVAPHRASLGWSVGF
jgi:hypothetical protein